MQIYTTRSKQGFNSDLEGPAKKYGAQKSCEGPRKFYSSTFFNFYFNPRWPPSSTVWSLHSDVSRFT